MLTKLFDIKTNILNIRDVFRFAAGTVQSYFLLRKLKPNALFLKGGFVCVPVAFSARLHNVPYITHDSDALPGLSNRIAARWARYHAVALPAEYYSYPQKTVRVVGVPVDERFRNYSPAEKAILRAKYGVPEKARVLLVTGGSNGARRLNEAVIAILPRLLKEIPDLYVLHQIGVGNDDQKRPLLKLADKVQNRVTFFDFSPELFHMSAIANAVVTRAGASAIADLANQQKACVVVPNPYLTGGHQLRNAEVYEDAKAAIIVREEQMLSSNAGNLYNSILSVLTNDSQQKELGKNLRKLVPEISAAAALSDLISKVAR